MFGYWHTEDLGTTKPTDKQAVVFYLTLVCPMRPRNRYRNRNLHLYKIRILFPVSLSTEYKVNAD